MSADHPRARSCDPGPVYRRVGALGGRAVLMVVQAGLGLAVSGLYPEQPWAVAAFRGNDLVTLLVAAPVLAVALVASRRRESSASVLVWLGMLHYGVYNYAYYSFGAAFNSAFLLHVAALVASLGGLLMLATSIDAGRAARGVVGDAVAGRRGLRDRRRGRARRRLGRAVAALRPDRRPAHERHASLGRAPRLRHRPVAAGARVRRRRGAALVPPGVGLGARRGHQRQRSGVPRRAVGGRRFPGGCRDRRARPGSPPWRSARSSPASPPRWPCSCDPNARRHQDRAAAPRAEQLHLTQGLLGCRDPTGMLTSPTAR